MIKINKKREPLMLGALIFALSCAVAATTTDFATLRVDSDTGQVTLGAVGDRHTAPMAMSFQNGDIIVDSTSSGLEACNETHQKIVNFMFADDGIASVSQMGKYALRVKQSNCETAGRAQLGLRTAESPLWQIWTYASFSRDEIRLGRNHPKNSYTLSGKHASIKCDGGLAERMCLLRDATIDGDFVGETFDVDFEFGSDKIVVPTRVYMHYTSVSNCDSRNAAEWPALVLSCNASGGEPIRVQSSLFISEESLAELEGDACEYMSRVLRTSGKLVAHEDPRLILLGSAIFKDYTFDRDYIHNTLFKRVVLSADHFSLFELFMLIFVFTVYIYYKSDPTERNGAFLVGTLPLCSVCNRAYVAACPVHVVRKAIIVNYVCVVMLFAIAWYTVGVSSRVGVGIDETDLLVWAFVSLGVATLEYAAYAIYRATTTHANASNSALHWELVGVASVKSACGVAMLSLASVVRADDLSSMLNLAIALFVIYDGLRRFVEDVFATFSVRHQHQSTLIGWRVAWPLRTLGVSGALGAGFTVYALTRHIVYETLMSQTFTAIFLLVCAYFAIILNLACMRRAMLAQLRKLLEAQKIE